MTRSRSHWAQQRAIREEVVASYFRGVEKAIEAHARSGYGHGCRCPDCTRVHSERAREYRERQRFAQRQPTQKVDLP